MEFNTLGVCFDVSLNGPANLSVFKANGNTFTVYNSYFFSSWNAINSTLHRLFFLFLYKFLFGHIWWWCEKKVSIVLSVLVYSIFFVLSLHSKCVYFSIYFFSIDNLNTHSSSLLRYYCFSLVQSYSINFIWLPKSSNKESLIDKSRLILSIMTRQKFTNEYHKHFDVSFQLHKTYFIILNPWCSFAVGFLASTILNELNFFWKWRKKKFFKKQINAI